MIYFKGKNSREVGLFHLVEHPDAMILRDYRIYSNLVSLEAGNWGPSREPLSLE